MIKRCGVIFLSLVSFRRINSEVYYKGVLETLFWHLLHIYTGSLCLGTV